MSLRVAVIGCGPIGNRHADLYQADPLAELVAVCDIRKDRCDTAAQRLGVPGFYDAPTMLATIKPDLVSVATGGIEYGSDHYLPTIQALAAGCHVLCEKPICNTIPEAEKMVACAKKHQRCFAIDFNHRFTDAAKVAKKWVDDGLIGHQLFINMSMWIKNPNESSPFYMIKALNPHSVDVMRHFGGDICAVHAFCTTAPGRTIHTTMSMNVRFTSGAVGHLSASYDIERGHPMERCEVAGVKGRLVLDDMWREATLYPAGNPIKQVYTNPVFGGHRDFVDTFRNRIHRFLEQVSAGTAPDAIDGSGADGLAAQKVLQGAIDSVVTGGVIQL
ncbi:Gfo/Idh/MocA family protein [Oligosphaera ethanolica]|uniref:Dehydrogenase n=1 Tax=Oligosphaera ethanolica TaxID=760260 RepID=A0AAE3VI16_9BACT|nr:Gfo/Idh/MocA family oxidoreductase [Oligosphaera ethanolica]MDQ0290761.1 putative dehydrogenase [Oligosphaera ethanolica]